MLNNDKTKIRGKSIFFSRKSSVPVKLFRAYIYAVLLLSIVNVFITYQKVKTESMFPEIKKNESVFIHKAAYGIKLPLIHLNRNNETISYAKPKRGDVVLIKDPKKEKKNIIIRFINFFIKPLTFGIIDLAPNNYLVKRIVALPKEKVEIKNKIVYIDDRAIKMKASIIFKDKRILPKEVSFRDNTKAIIIPFNSYFVLSDNRDYAYDSRNFGLVERKGILGKILR